MLTLEEEYQNSNPQAAADVVASRFVEPDKSVRPLQDTGFRFPWRHGLKPYRNPEIKTYRDTPYIDCVHWDDMTDIGQGTLNGQPLDSVRTYTINYPRATERANYWTQRQLSDRVGETCLCEAEFGKGWPFSVPCMDCGAGL